MKKPIKDLRKLKDAVVKAARVWMECDGDHDCQLSPGCSGCDLLVALRRLQRAEKY